MHSLAQGLPAGLLLPCRYICGDQRHLHTIWCRPARAIRRKACHLAIHMTVMLAQSCPGRHLTKMMHSLRS